MCIGLAEIQEGMQGKNFRKQLAATVRNIQWSYAIFWTSSASQQGVLTWRDGYYNGDIKTRKTTQPMEFKADQIGLQRSEQLRELYESLLADENNQQTTTRPSASLSPEDLTASEWYYLVCMSFTFSPGQGLPGRALASNQHIWVSNAQFADSRTFSRSLLAKSASIQTVVCFPFMDGVLELGTTEQVLEDRGLIQQVTTAFWDLPISVCSEQSISNSPFEEKDEEGTVHPIPGQGIEDVMDLENQNLLSEHHSPLKQVLSPFAFNFPLYAPNEETVLAHDRVEELNPNMDELRNGSPNYSSNDSFKMDDCMSFANTPMILASPKDGRTKNSVLNDLQEGNFAIDLDGDGTHYQKTLLAILKNSKYSDSMLFFLNSSRASSFTIWRRSMNFAKPVGNKHQKMLKNILVDMSWIPFQRQEENSIRNKVLKQDGDDAGANHVLSERRRREKLNEKFVILRSLVPSISKVDKASILADTIEYLKELERRVQQLESNKETVESDTRDKRKHPDVSERTSDNYNNENANKRKPSASKRKACVIDENDEERDRSIISKNNAVTINVTVIEKEVMLEMTCPWRDCLLMEIVNVISNLQLEAYSVRSSAVNGILTVTLKAKFRGLAVVTPGMVKRALQRVVGKC